MDHFFLLRLVKAKRSIKIVDKKNTILQKPNAGSNWKNNLQGRKKSDKVAQSWTKLDKVGQSWTKLHKVGQSCTKLDKIGHNSTKIDKNDSL